MKRTSLCVLFCLAISNFSLGAEVEVFSCDFEDGTVNGVSNSGINASWSGVTGVTGDDGYSAVINTSGFSSYGFGSQFLYNSTGGNYGGDAHRFVLNLNNLPEYQSVSVQFDVAFIDTWDGSYSSCGPDYFNCAINGDMQFRQTVTNFNHYPMEFSPLVENTIISRSDTLSVMDIRYVGNPETAYTFEMNYADNTSSLTIEWYADGGGWQGGYDEAWAIDNIQVIIYQKDTSVSLNLSSSDGGSVDTPGEGAFTYDQGDVAEVVAVPDSHYQFVNWTGTAVDAGMVADATAVSTEVTMDADYSLVANFEPFYSSSLVAHYELNDNANDSSGFGNHGVVTNTTSVPDRNGNLLSAFYFGTDARVVVPDSDTLDTPQMTLAAWIKLDTLMPRHQTIVAKWGQGTSGGPGINTYAFEIIPNSPVLKLTLYAEDYHRIVQTTAQVELNTWTHVAATYDGNAARIYINGQLEAVLNWTGPLRLGSAPFCIAYNGFSNDLVDFMGSIDDVRVYNYAAGEEAIDQLITDSSYVLETSSSIGGFVTVPGEGAYTYEDGVVVDLVATPHDHYHFVEWVGPVADSTSATTSVTVNEDMEVQAVFAIDQFNVTLSSSMGGTIIEPGEGEFLFDYGTMLALDAGIDDLLFEFSHYTGSLATSANPYHYFTVTGDSAIHAVFHSMQDVLYVDGSIPACQYENGTDEYPFDTIQEAIEVAPEGATLMICSGTYCENLELPLKSLTLTGVDVNDWAFPVIEGVGDAPVVTRRWGADTPVLLQGLDLRGGDGKLAGAIDCRQSQLTLANCVITGNRCDNSQGLGGAVFAYDSQVNLVNCTLSGNYSSSKGAALYAGNGSTVTVLDSILWDNVPMEILSDATSEVVVQYSDLTDLTEGEGNLNEDPQFVAPGYWKHALNPGMLVLASHTYAVWQVGDYHLDVDSPCIDTGDPNELGDDMGAYGNTSEATADQVK